MTRPASFSTAASRRVSSSAPSCWRMEWMSSAQTSRTGFCRSISRGPSHSGWCERSRSATRSEGLDRTVGQQKESRAMTDHEARMSREALANLGDGKIAYVRTVRSEDVPAMFPQAPELQPGLELFALHAADGTPIMLTDSREAAIANAWSQELETVSVH